ncbi:unnamed protein product, partial [Brenthis ino]
MSKIISNAVFWYFNEVTSRVVAESGIASDRHHLGKILFQSFKDAPDMIMQIDGSTGKKETSKSALERTVRCATSFRNIGLEYQDVILVMAPNHLDVTIPIYASFYLGLNVATIDMNYGVYELQETLKCVVPKIIFCENSNVNNVQEALQLSNMSAHIVTFGEKKEHMSFSEFLIKYDDNNTTVENFKPSNFDPKVTNLILAATSGSTELPKAVMMTHENVSINFPHAFCGVHEFPSPFKVGLVISPIQWVSAIIQFIMSPILRYTRVQTSSPISPEHVTFLINKYKPEFFIISPTFLTSLFKYSLKEKCDFTSFKYILVGGSVVSEELLNEMTKESPQTHIHNSYGLTEISGIFSMGVHSPRNSIGQPLGVALYKIVSLETNETISRPNVPGELRLKGPSVCKGYYNKPEETAEAFDEDGWYKTGDIVYKDEHSNFYFLGRIKLLLKYNNHQISPVELESVIMKHPGVLDVAVTGIPDPECGDLPVAVVIAHDDFDVTAQDIKDLVKKTLSDPKQLRGGVIFIKDFPTTATSKIDRTKLKELAMRMKRE